MQTKLINKPPTRLFAFGCSFTKYNWATWPEIIAHDLDIPFYNYGKSGGGNQYIANMICQADEFYKFTSDDLVIVSWTNVCREDKWKKGGWITPGNIFTQNEYDPAYIKNWADPIGYMIRDFATIKLISSLLKNSGCQYHLLSMCDINIQIDQGNANIIDPNFKSFYDTVCQTYKKELDQILPSFFKTLWKNDIYRNKLLPDKELYGNKFSDGHPNPKDHYIFLKEIFDHKFSESTDNAVKKSQNNLVKFIQDTSNIKKKEFAVYNLNFEELQNLESSTQIKISERIKFF